MWNWQLPSWPKFTYDHDLIAQSEKKFLLGIGNALAYLKNVTPQESDQFLVEILSSDGIESSKIEGEILDRESLQSSIKRVFGLNHSSGKQKNKELGMANLLHDVHATYNQPLTHEMLEKWHLHLFKDQTTITDCGKYRTHEEPMQIVSGRYDRMKVFYEAPPSAKIFKEMSLFIDWFNASTNEPILGRSAIAHVYFECVHPFEDGNGRIGRALAQKVISQGIGHPVLISVSTVLEKRKKEYYAALERCNKTLQVDEWVEFFSDVILQAQKESIDVLFFLIQKSKMMRELSPHLNPRQEKVLIRMFAEGPEGFKGGLSAENYLTITKTSRATATRDLSELTALGALKKTGELRHTRYFLNLDAKNL